jgi:hypothetical protein
MYLPEQLLGLEATTRKAKKFRGADLFCGAGGTSQGIIDVATAFDMHCELTGVNHWPVAIATHSVNLPQAQHLCEDLHNCNPRKLFGEGDLDVLWASPSCFVAGTLILTKRGQIPIEDIQIGDEVLTHKNRWRKVTEIMKRYAPKTCILKGHGHPGLETTPEHPFYSKRWNWRYPNRKKANGKRENKILNLENPFWPKANTLVERNYRWATPTWMEPLPIPQPDFPGVQFDENLFEFLGRWVGDGYLSQTSGEIYISCGYHEHETVFTELSNTKLIKNNDGAPISFWQEYGETAGRVVTSSVALHKWIKENFGEYCDRKKIPTWLLTVQHSWKESLMIGLRNC